MTRRTLLFIIVLVAMLTWGGIALYTRYVPPTTFMAYVAFFLLLTVALTGTLTPLAYGIGYRFLAARRYHVTVRQALRQGTLLSLAVVLNLILRVLQSWNVFMAIILLGVAVVIEILFLARK